MGVGLEARVELVFEVELEAEVGLVFEVVLELALELLESSPGTCFLDDESLTAAF